MVRSTLAVSWPTAAASTSTISGAELGTEPSPGISAIVARSTSLDLANTHAAVRLVIEYGSGVASRWTTSELVAANVALKAASVLVCLDGDPANTFHVVTWLDDAVDARCTSTTYAVYAGGGGGDVHDHAGGTDGDAGEVLDLLVTHLQHPATKRRGRGRRKRRPRRPRRPRLGRRGAPGVQAASRWRPGGVQVAAK